jgi:CelD/BcsL family acetyltransferase involved in cellulose biosynthesis
MAGPPLPMKSELISDATEIGAIEDDWRALAELRGNAFLTPEWFWCWTDSHPESISPLVIAVRRDGGELAGVLPLVLDRGRRPWAVRFAGASFGDHFGPASREEDEASVATAAMSALADEGLDRYMLMLNRVDPAGGWWQEIGNGSRAARVRFVQQRAELPCIRLEGLDWEGYLQTRSSSFRKKLRQRDRKLEREGTVVVRATTDDSLESDLAHFFALHERRWEERSSLEDGDAKQSLSRFAEAAQRHGWLRLRVLEVDGTPVAAFLGWRLGDTFTFYQSGFDPDWSELSVGMVLLTRTIESAIEEGAAEFDMLLGDEAYKKRFQNHSREVHTVVLARRRSPARVLLSLESGARRGAARLSKGPRTAAAARALRRLMPTSRGA